MESGVGSAETATERTWKYKYHAAAIYLEQGENNEKFSTHPVSHRALPAYVMVHNGWFYAVDAAAAIALLALALIEKPAIFAEVPPWIHSMLELLCLFVISLELGVKVQWLGWSQFVHHKRTVLKTLVLVVMLAEAMTVLIREQSHFRITRALRPIFLIDSHYSYNVRRFVRQTLQSIPAVLDMLLLLIGLMFVYAILGYFFYKDVDPDYFGDPATSFVSLFVLLTTANNPDVMMQAYAASRWNALFFISFTCIELYFLMNLLLAVVYDTFASNEKAKFRKLFLHRREAAERALDLLNEAPGQHKEVRIERFIGMLHFLGSHNNLRDMFLAFLVLNKSGSGRVSEAEFYQVYDVLGLSWKKESRSGSGLPGWVKRCLDGLKQLVRSRPFRWLFHFVAFLTGVWYAIEVYLKSSAVQSLHQDYLAVSISFCAVFGLEFLLKLLGLGPKEYWRSGWNIYDGLITLTSTAGVCLYQADHPFTHLIILRFISVSQLLRIKKSYRDIFNTVAILTPRFASASVVLFVIYYFFAILGMECFSHLTLQLRNCCNDTLVAGEYVYDPLNNHTYGYYLNSFDNILVSAVTLWDLMVVNNWFIIMEGFTSVSATPAARLFFMLYFIVMMVVLTIVVAFILEGFLFRIQCSRAGDGSGDEQGYLEEKLRVPRTEVELLCGKGASISDWELATIRRGADHDDPQVEFVGFRWKDRSDFSKELYASEIESWISERDAAARALSRASSNLSRDPEPPDTNDQGPAD